MSKDIVLGDFQQQKSSVYSVVKGNKYELPVMVCLLAALKKMAVILVSLIIQ